MCEEIARITYNNKSPTSYVLMFIKGLRGSIYNQCMEMNKRNESKAGINHLTVVPTNFDEKREEEGGREELKATV